MRALALAIFIFIANTAWADDDRGGYIGGSLGVSDTPAECTSNLLPNSSPRCEGNVLGARGFLGYAFSRQLAIEGGVAATGANGAGAAALDFSGLASLPLSERVSLFGRLGFVTDTSFADLTYGAGLRFDLESKASLRLEWQHFGSDGGIDFLFLGILNRF